MKSLILIAMLSLSACATLTGDPIADCLAARNATSAAQAAATLSAVVAANNPQSATMQQAAALASASLAIAQAQQAAVCPVIN